MSCPQSIGGILFSMNWTGVVHQIKVLYASLPRPGARVLTETFFTFTKGGHALPVSTSLNKATGGISLTFQGMSDTTNAEMLCHTPTLHFANTA